MNESNLGDVVIRIVDRYQQAAQHLMSAYENGVERATRSSSERFAARVRGAALPLLTDAARTGLVDVQQRGAQIVVDGVRARHAALSRANERIAAGVRAGVERVAEAVERREQAFDGKAARTLAQLGLPSARLSLSVADAVADAAERVDVQAAAAAEAVAQAVVETTEAVDAVARPAKKQPAPRKAARRRARA